MKYLEICKKYITEDEYRNSDCFAAVTAGEMSEEDAYLRLLCRKEWMYGSDIERGRKSEIDAKIAVCRYLDLIGEDFIEDRLRRYEIEKKYEPVRQDYRERESEKKREIEKIKKRRKNAIPLSAAFLLTIPFLYELVTFGYVLPAGLYGSVPAAILIWFPIAGLIDYYYKKKIERLEKDMKLLGQEEHRMSNQEFREKYGSN